MTPEMQKFIDLLESELGYSDKGGGSTKFGEWYGKNVEFDADYSAAPWCDMYLSWAAHKLGYEDWVGQFAWTVAHAEWFKEQDAWGTKPKPGAIVFYDWSGSDSIDEIDHVGIVTKTAGDTIFTIEGNIDGGVAKRKERDTSKVVGYGYPEKIKERLDAQAKLKEVPQEGEPSAPTDSTEVGIGEVAVPEPGLSALIPETGSGPEPQAAQGPIVARTGTPVKPSTKKTTASTSPSASASPEPKVKKGKHVKPATADTLAVTSSPAPSLVTVAAPITAPSLSSPALVGTALVAALAVLAVAKTRQLRVRLAPAAAASAPVGRRRRTRGAPKRSRTDRHLAAAAVLDRDLVDLPAFTTGTVDRDLADLTARPLDHDLADLATFTTGTLDRNLADLTPGILERDPRSSDAGSEAHAAGGMAHESLVPGAGAREAVSAEGLARQAREAAAALAEQAATAEFDAFAPPSKAAMDETFDAMVAGVRESFDAMEHDVLATYRGRRRLRRPDETPTASTDTPPRGRRHRATDQSHTRPTGYHSGNDPQRTPDEARTHGTGHRSPGRGHVPAEPPPAFTQETPLRGRRHRATHEALGTPPMPEALPVSGVAPASEASPVPEGTRAGRFGRGRSGGGRHRA